MAKKKYNRKKIIKIISQYGIHIWAIFIIANAALAYAYHFSTHADTKVQSVTSVLLDSPSPSAEPSTAADPAISQAPKGPTLSLDFTIPGIGSGGGNLSPKRLQRNVTIYLYGTDVNSMNKTVKPLYTIKGIAYYDSNKDSPTYTTYYTNPIDLGAAVKDGSYQVAFRTDQSLRTLIKDNPSDISGKIISLAFNQQTPPFGTQTVLMGDTIPKDGDNSIDISDYNAFINCFGERDTSAFCSANNYGDFNDDGVIDGIDYNILLLSFQALLNQGQPIPQITLAPTGPQRVSRLSHLTTPTPTEKKSKPVATPVASAAASTSTGSGSAGNVLGGILFFFFVIILGVIGFILYKKNANVRAKMQVFLSMLPIKIPAPKAPETTETPAAEQTVADPNAVTPEATPSTDANTTTETTPDTATIAASTEVPIDQLPQTEQTPVPESPTPDSSLPVAAPVETPAVENPLAPTPATTPSTVVPDDAKDYYLKKKGTDDAGTGFWYTLTDDNGPVEAHYTGAEIADGFAKVKGTMQTENGKTFLEASEIIAEG